MPLETATYISDLVTSNPAASDPLSGADDHLRLLKATLKATFPNFTAAPLNSTQAQLDAIAALMVNGVLRGNGTVPSGFIGDFAGTTAPVGWLECNGAAVSRATYADLFTAIGTTWGPGDGSTTFNLPPDRYRRGRNAAAAAVGTLQADQNKTHTHTGSGNTTLQSISLDHQHAFSGSTGTESNFHTHNVDAPNTKTTPASVVGGASAFFWTGNGAAVATSNNNQLHTHPFSGGTGGADRTLDHVHGFSFTTSGGSADAAEARPLSATFLTCIKT